MWWTGGLFPSVTSASVLVLVLISKQTSIVFSVQFFRLDNGRSPVKSSIRPAELKTGGVRITVLALSFAAGSLQAFPVVLIRPMVWWMSFSFSWSTSVSVDVVRTKGQHQIPPLFRVIFLSKSDSNLLTDVFTWCISILIRLFNPIICSHASKTSVMHTAAIQWLK